MPSDNGKYYLSLRMQNGEKKDYQLTVARVLASHPDGTPKLLDLMRDKDTVHLEGGEQFVTMWMPKEMMGNGGNG